MSRYLLTQSVKMTVTLSLNVVVQDGNRNRVVTLPLVTLTPLLFTLWLIRYTLTRHWLNLSDLIGAILELADAVTMGFVPFWNVACIIGKSVAFGLGVRL